MAEEGPLSRFLAVVGPSGSGKSSLVRAGVVPALKQGKLPGSDRWLVVEMLPGAHPLEELDALLLSITANPVETLMGLLKEDERGLIRAAKRVLPRDESIELVLVIDQFEEVFTLIEDEPGRVRFLELLCAASTDPRSRVRVIVTLRADFFDRPLLYPDPGELMRQRTAVVLPLSAEELERAIVKPAQRAGLSIEPELLASIIKDVGEQLGALPLLQYALTELFERRKGRIMTLEAYRASGGVLGALGRRADEIYEELNEEEREACRQLFLRLVTLGEGVEDTRRRARRSELESISGSKEALNRVIERFGRYRLLTFDMDPVTKGPTVEVAHEALIRTWGRLQEWLEESRADLRVQRQLMAASAEWEAAGKDASFLATGARLVQFESLGEGAGKAGGVALTQDEREYLQASIEERERQEQAEKERQARELELARQRESAQRSAASRLRYLVVGLLVFLAAAIILSGWALNRSQAADDSAKQAQSAAATAVANQQEADTQKQQAQTNFEHADALRLAADANTLLTDVQNPSLIALLALRSNNVEHTPQGDAALDGAMGLVYPLRVFEGHTDGVWRIVSSPDGTSADGSLLLGKYILTASSDKTARLWDAQTGKELQKFDHPDAVLSVAFSPDGTQALTGCADGIARVWDIRTGKEIREFKGHTGAILRVAFSHNAKYVLTSSADKTTGLWDAATGTEVRRFAGQPGAGIGSGTGSTAGFLEGDKFVITASVPDQTAAVWDVRTGQETRQFHMESGAGAPPDGRFKYLLLDSDTDQALVLWDTETGDRMVSLPTGAWASDYVSPDGKTVLAGMSTGEVQMWDAQTGVKMKEFTGLKSKVFSVALSPDGKSVAASDESGFAILWDIQSGQQLRRYAGHTGPVRNIMFSPDGRYLLTSGSSDNVMRLWETGSLVGLPRFVGHTGGVQTASFSPDGKLIVTASNDGTARLWNAATGEQIRTFEGHTDVVNWAAFSHNGQRVFTAGLDRTARLWDVGTGKQLARIDNQGQVDSVALSHDGQYGLVGGGQVLLYDFQTGTQVYTLTVSNVGAGFYGMDFSPDDKYFVTGSDDTIARLWETKTGKLVREFKGHTSTIYGAVFSPDGKYILTGSLDKTARLWDVQTGREVRRFLGHTADVYGVAFSHNGKYVVTASNDRTARVWDVATGKELRRLTGHTDGVIWAEFSPDDKMVVTGSNDGTARLWYTDFHEAVSYLCGKVLRDFTADERAQYEIKDNAPTCPAK